jgi:hypothetical protein
MSLTANIPVTAIASLFFCSAWIVVAKDISTGIIFLTLASIFYFGFRIVNHIHKMEYAKLTRFKKNTLVILIFKKTQIVKIK